MCCWVTLLWWVFASRVLQGAGFAPNARVGTAPELNILLAVLVTMPLAAFALVDGVHTGDLSALCGPAWGWRFRYGCVKPVGILPFFWGYV